MKSWFQAFAFKWVNLYGYAAAAGRMVHNRETKIRHWEQRGNTVGLCRLNQVDP
jgi:hypothetical protein